MNKDTVYSVTDFVAICNQVLDLSFGNIQICGELANFKISKERWVYFDLKDDFSSLHFFGSVYDLPGPLEEGMVVVVSGVPRLHPRFGFSVNIKAVQLSGEGTIKKAMTLLEQKLDKEGLFDASRKRQLPFSPMSVGIISSSESAGYADFIKIVDERWAGLDIKLIDVQVQGERSVSQVVKAVEYFNQHFPDIEVLVITRGGGSSDDLQTFNHENVVRAISASRIPTMVAIGHEIDTTLSERVADVRASTPSNAAQLLVPEKTQILEMLQNYKPTLLQYLHVIFKQTKNNLTVQNDSLLEYACNSLKLAKINLDYLTKNLQMLDPIQTLKRGFVVVRQKGDLVSSSQALSLKTPFTLQFHDGIIEVVPSRDNGL